MTGPVLTSKWDGLSPSLLASVYAVDSGGAPIAGAPMVLAPFTEAQLEVSANWQSPFEQSGLDNRLPAISALAQTGALGSYIDMFGNNGGGEDTLVGRLVSSFNQSVSEFATTAAQATQGRSGLTKLNSQQVFTGAMPIKVTATMIFRAFDNPQTEVVAPVDQLIRWTLARELAQNAAAAQAFRNLADGQGLLKAALPSLTPTMVAIRYAGFTLSPMVIESVSKPLTVPRYRDGSALQEQVQVTFGSLTALDENDWIRARRGNPIKLFNNR